MRNVLRVPGILLVLAVSAGAVADEPGMLSPEARERLTGLLRAYEHQATAEDFLSLGDKALVRDALIEIVVDDGQAALLRGRAVVALGFFPDEASRRAIEGVLDRPELSDIILRRALETMAHAFADAGISRLTPYLDDARPDVRETAARALGEIGSPEALRALRRRLDRETTDVVREALETQIRRLEGTTTVE